MNLDPTGHAWWKKLENAISNFCNKVVFVVKEIVRAAVDTIDTIVQTVVNAVGATISTGNDIPIDVIPIVPPIITLETGIGYSKSFGNTKTINFYAEGTNLLDWSIGYNINIGDYNFHRGLGLLSSSWGISNGSFSFDSGLSTPGEASFKSAYALNDGYTYNKLTFDFSDIIWSAIKIKLGAPFLQAARGFLSSASAWIPNTLFS